MMYNECVLLFFFFFFQAEDGIRDYKVTGVQTCALPIYHQERHGGDLPEIVDHLLGGGEGEVVGLVVGDAPFDAQHSADFIKGLWQLARLGGHDDGVVVRVGVHFHQHSIGHQHACVGVSEERCGGPQHGPNHLELVAVHQNGLAHRVDIGVQALLDVLADDGHGHAAAALFVGKETAAVNVHLPAAGVGFLRAHHVDVVDVVALVAGVVHAGGEHHGGNVLHRFAPFADVHGVLVRQVFADALLGREAGGSRAYGEFEDDDRIRPETAQHRSNGSVKARQDRRHADDGA